MYMYNILQISGNLHFDKALSDKAYSWKCVERPFNYIGILKKVVFINTLQCLNFQIHMSNKTSCSCSI